MQTIRRQLPRLAAAIVAGSALTVTGLVHAATATTSFTVTANIAAACTVNATNLAFGTYSPAAATALTATSTINVLCTTGTTYAIALNVGSGTGSTYTTREMVNGPSLMGYNLYTSSAMTTVWGDATGATATVPGTGSGVLTATPSTVYGSIPASQDLPAGTYSSTITVTVTY